jgi:hypothetical protein
MVRQPFNSASTGPAGGSYLVIWEFMVKPEARLAFEKTYAPDGDWAQLFRLSPDYCGTELFCGFDQSARYITLDRWTSRDALARFKQAHHPEYAALDRRCEDFTDTEVLIGEFEIPGL